MSSQVNLKIIKAIKKYPYKIKDLKGVFYGKQKEEGVDNAKGT